MQSIVTSKPTVAEARHPRVVIETSMGEIKVELFDQEAPLSVDNFLSYVKSDFYSGTIFHRVIPGFMIQGGGFHQNLALKPAKAPIRNESSNGIKNTRGTLATARTVKPDSATSQFFVNLVDNPSLDPPSNNGYGFSAVFGRVTEGMDVVDLIAAVPTGSEKGFKDVPREPVVIKSMRVLR
nr:peptidylprolyl isomerase [Geoanaerobacter pelophilus]